MTKTEQTVQLSCAWYASAEWPQLRAHIASAEPKVTMADVAERPLSDHDLRTRVHSQYFNQGWLWLDGSCPLSVSWS